MTPAPISVERLRELLEKATALPWEADAGTVRPAPESPDRVTIAYCSGEGSPQGEADAELIAAAINALPALLHQLAERDAEVERLREYVREADRRVGEQFMAAQRAEAEALRLLNRCGEAFDRTRAAERDREEACGLMREVYDTVVLAKPITPQPVNLVDRIAAFLAANK